MSDLWSAFLATCRRWPERPAWLRGDERMTFGQWRRRSEAWAAALLDRGVAEGDRVVVWAETSLEIAAAICGCWGAGAIAVLLDPDTRAERVALLEAELEPRAWACSQHAAPPISRARLPVVRPADAGRSTGRRLPGVSGAHARASILYTSGSSGRPKGVVQIHGALTRGCRRVARSIGVDATTRNLCPVPWSFDYGYGQLQQSVVLGVTGVLPVAAHPAAICEALETHRPNLLAGVPSLFAYLLQGLSPFASSDRSSLQRVTSTGSALPRPVLDRLLELLPEARLYLNYGLTESYRTSCLDPDLLPAAAHTVGRPIEGVEVLIVRDDASRAGPGEEGEIVHCGDTLCEGYWRNPEATARALRPDPRDPGGQGRVLFTGDRGWLDEDGLLVFRGRRDRQIKTMGYRVQPLEVEEILLASRWIDDVAVVGVERDLIGHELCAVVVGSPGIDDLERRLKRYAREHLPRHLQPRRWHFDLPIPRTPSGKTDYPALDESLRAPNRSRAKGRGQVVD